MRTLTYLWDRRKSTLKTKPVTIPTTACTWQRGRAGFTAQFGFRRAGLAHSGSVGGTSRSCASSDRKWLLGAFRRFKFLRGGGLSLVAGVCLLTRMAVDVKSRAKRYEKLDFLGEGQVRPWAESAGGRFSRRHCLATAGWCPLSSSLSFLPTGEEEAPRPRSRTWRVPSRVRVSLFLKGGRRREVSLSQNQPPGRPLTNLLLFSFLVCYGL